MSEYDARQFVGIDLHRRRSVIVRTTDAGEALEVVRINNDVDSLAAVMARAGEAPEVVLEARYGWYWAVDALEAAGADVHLAHPLGVKMFERRRVKNDVRDASDLADLLRMGRLPEAWVAPPPTRELRELVRHRAKLVALRSGCKCQVHAVLAKLGVQVPMSDLFSDRGLQLLAAVDAPAPYVARIQSLERLIDALDVEVDLFARLARGKLVANPGYRAVQTIPGIGPVLAAVFVAEVGDVHRFPTAAHLTSWAGLTPKHHESDAHVRRGRITKQGSKLGCDRVGQAGRFAHHSRRAAWAGRCPQRRSGRQEHRLGCGRPPTGRARLLRPTRRTRPCPPPGHGMNHQTLLASCSVVQVMTPELLGAVARFD